MPGFIAKKSIKNIPSVGLVSTAIGSLFMDRRDKSDKNKLFDMIRERQEAVE